MNHIENFKKAFFIRKTEELFLELFKEGKISGTVHTCIGQEFTGIFASKYSMSGDFIVSNHRGHGHYISFTNDYEGLINELLGNVNGCSKGIGGSQHLFYENFLSNGIQGGMLAIAAGVAMGNKLRNNNKIAIAFIGDGTLGEGILYETLNICSLWDIPIVIIVEKNYISQSTSFDQNFSGNLKMRIEGFGIEFHSSTIYDLNELDQTFESVFRKARFDGKPILVEVEVARLYSHSKGDDNRDLEKIEVLRQKDPLNQFIENNSVLISKWETEINSLHNRILSESDQKNAINLHKHIEVNLNDIIQSDNIYLNYDFQSKSEKRFNDLIYIELKNILSNIPESIIIGEDIENSNQYNSQPYGGAFRVTKDLSNLFPEKVKNTPISEQAITGVAAGLALNGYTSIVEIMFGDFTTLAFDQLLQHISKFTLMYGIDLELPFIMRTPMGGFRGYGPTHSQSLEKHFLGIPGLDVLALNQLVHPSLIFKKIINNKRPVLLIENKILYTKRLFDDIPDGYEVKILDHSNKYPIVKVSPIEGIPNVTCICYGGILNEVLISAKELFDIHEILVEVFIPTDLNDIIIPQLQNSIINTRFLCIVQEGSSYVSFGSEIVFQLKKENIIDFKLLSISNNSIIPSSRDKEQNVLPSSKKITQLILNNI
jgi:2-oxoisovalerate dehydrogenase E1 component